MQVLALSTEISPIAGKSPPKHSAPFSHFNSRNTFTLYELSDQTVPLFLLGFFCQREKLDLYERVSSCFPSRSLHYVCNWSAMRMARENVSKWAELNKEHFSKWNLTIGKSRASLIQVQHRLFSKNYLSQHDMLKRNYSKAMVLLYKALCRIQVLHQK